MKKIIIISLLMLIGSLLFLSVSALIIKNNIDNVYEKIIKQEPVYEYVCQLGKYNQSTKKINPELCNYKIDYYKEIIIITDKYIGIKEDEKIILNAYKSGNIVSRWSVPIGDRNFEEFGRCREYEKEKGVCSED